MTFIDEFCDFLVKMKKDANISIIKLLQSNCSNHCNLAHSNICNATKIAIVHNCYVYNSDRPCVAEGNTAGAV